MEGKRVDESWKEKIQKEKESNVNGLKQDDQTPPTQSKPETMDENNDHMPEVSFNVFITSLGMQALMFLGEIENPMTNKKEVDIHQAKYLIDTLGMLEEKTEGNLDEQEKQVITQLLYELRLKFVEKSK
ncbi:MAG: DUF1844 domain-containing protein [Candidatus Omnitrophota bacterium]